MTHYGRGGLRNHPSPVEFKSSVERYPATLSGRLKIRYGIQQIHTAMIQFMGLAAAVLFWRQARPSVSDIIFDVVPLDFTNLMQITISGDLMLPKLTFNLTV
jgi:hypothetical protein